MLNTINDVHREVNTRTLVTITFIVFVKGAGLSIVKLHIMPIFYNIVIIPTIKHVMESIRHNIVSL